MIKPYLAPLIAEVPFPFFSHVLWPGKARPLLQAVDSVARLGPADHGVGLFLVCKSTVLIPENRLGEPLKSRRGRT